MFYGFVAHGHQIFITEATDKIFLIDGYAKYPYLLVSIILKVTGTYYLPIYAHTSKKRILPNNNAHGITRVALAEQSLTCPVREQTILHFLQN